MNENIVWAVLILCVTASCIASDALKVYERTHSPQIITK
jgi:hypothetical protein